MFEYQKPSDEELAQEAAATGHGESTSQPHPKAGTMLLLADTMLLLADTMLLLADTRLLLAEFISSWNTQQVLMPGCSVVG